MFSDSQDGLSGFGSLVSCAVTAVVVIALVLAVIGIIYCVRVCKRPQEQDNLKHAEETILISSCCHCSKLDQKLKDKGYNIKMLFKEQLTENTSLNGVPLITCACEVSHQLLESLLEPDKLNIVQLYQTGNPLQSDGVIKTICYTDLDNDGPVVDEVLDWLKTKSCNF